MPDYALWEEFLSLQQEEAIRRMRTQLFRQLSANHFDWSSWVRDNRSPMRSFEIKDVSPHKHKLSLEE